MSIDILHHKALASLFSFKLKLLLLCLGISISAYSQLPPPDTNFFFIENNASACSLAGHVKDAKKKNSPLKSSQFTYKAYNKLTLEENYTKTKFSRFRNLLGRLGEDSIYLVFSESLSDRKHKSIVNDKEKITNSILLGVKSPGIITANSQLNSVFLYGKSIILVAKNYPNPLSTSTLNKYHFIVDSSYQDTSSIKLYFHPHKNARFETLKGYFILDKSTLAIKGSYLMPALGNGSLHYEQEYQLKDSFWFPKTSRLIIAPKKVNGQGQVNVNFQSHIYDIQLTDTLKSSSFDEYAFEYNDVSDTAEIEAKRRIPLTQIDEKTYTTYGQAKSFNQFGSYLALLEGIYFKDLRLKYFTVNLDKVAYVNRFEGLRLGLGLSSNQRLSKWFTTSAYWGYGFSDEQFKYGVGLDIHPSKKDKFSFSFRYKDDVEEAGRQDYIESPPMYFQEWLRALYIQNVDWVRSYEVSAKFRPYQNILIGGKLSVNENDPQYTYSSPLFNTSFNYTEASVQLKVNLGERYFKLKYNKFSLGSPYPAVWFEYARGIASLFDSDFSYNKFNFKTEYKVRIGTLGTSLFQLTAGYIDRPVPYFLVYNGKGAEEVLNVTHNSFETMKFNEFLSNRFVALYYTHNFGYFNFLKFRSFRPKIHVALNVGFGGLDNPELQQDIQFSTLRRGYYETGFLVKELITFKLPLIKLAAGIGFYYRFGPNALEQTFDNLVTKAAVGIAF